MDYVIIVNDNGELKTISATEVDSYNEKAGIAFASIINSLLDLRSLEEVSNAERNRQLARALEDDIDNDDGNTPVGIIGGVR